MLPSGTVELKQSIPYIVGLETRKNKILADISADAPTIQPPSVLFKKKVRIDAARRINKNMHVIEKTVRELKQICQSFLYFVDFYPQFFGKDGNVATVIFFLISE